jgi:diguanylate cyclase (GGDEF)-like protein/PAS domain S-box-containing protein
MNPDSSAADPGAAPAHPTLRVLYVEDDAQDAELARHVLGSRAAWLSLQVVTTLAEARRLLATLPASDYPDLILTDLQLLDGSGMDVLADVRTAGWPIAVVLITGHGDDAAAVAALRGGADDYIVKEGDYLRRLPKLLETALHNFRKLLQRHSQPLRVLCAERGSVSSHWLSQPAHGGLASCLLQESVHSAQGVLDRLVAALGRPQPPLDMRPDVRPDVLLLDVELPGMSSLDLVRELRQQRHLDLPIVLLTGPGDEAAALHALKLGATDYLPRREATPHRLCAVLESAHLRVQLERERAALRESEERLRQMAESIRDVFWLSDPKRNCILYINPAFERMWGYPAEAVYADPAIWLRSVYPDDRQRVASVFTDTLRNSDWELEFRAMRPDNSLRHVLMRGYAVRDAAGQLLRRAGIAQDITEQKQQEERIQHLAYHDALTGLPNRMLVMDRLARGLAVAQRQHRQLALLFMDLDRFKTINDTLGHLSGDSLLRQVAQRLQSSMREQDTVARLGGDEFLVLLEHVADVSDVAHVANKILSALALPFQLGKHELHVTVSIGVSLYPRDAQDTESLLKYADTALYKAKDAGRNTYRFFSPEMDAHAHAQLRLENELRRALDRGELLLHYQPQFDLDSGRLCGVEALLRWQHPQRGLVMPAEFIGLAEETGLMLPIGVWVLERACAQAQVWRRAGHELRMAVNLSGQQLRRPGLVAAVQQALDASGLPAAALELEMSESSVMKEAEQSNQLLYQLRELGVQLSMDDFGTGYSSLAQLKRLPLQRLKIDSSFIHRIDTDGDDEAIVAAILAMAHKMRLRVLAEGVETDAQCRLLMQLGCDEVQGHAFGVSMDAAAMGQLLAEHAGLDQLGDWRAGCSNWPVI